MKKIEYNPFTGNLDLLSSVDFSVLSKVECHGGLIDLYFNSESGTNIISIPVTDIFNKDFFYNIFDLKFLDKVCLIAENSQPQFVMQIADQSILHQIKYIEVQCGQSVRTITKELLNPQIVSTIDGALLKEGINTCTVTIYFIDSFNLPPVVVHKSTVLAVPPVYFGSTIVHPDGPTSPFNYIGIAEGSSVYVKIPKSLCVASHCPELFLGFRYLQITSEGLPVPLRFTGEEETIGNFAYCIYRTDTLHTDALYDVIIWFKS